MLKICLDFKQWPIEDEPNHVEEDLKSGDCLGVWSASVFEFSELKYVLFINEKTHFSFLCPQVIRGSMANFAELFLDIFYNAVLDCVGDFPENLRRHYSEVEFFEFENADAELHEKVTGMYKMYLEMESSNGGSDVDYIIKHINNYPSEELRELSPSVLMGAMLMKFNLLAKA